MLDDAAQDKVRVATRRKATEANLDYLMSAPPKSIDVAALCKAMDEAAEATGLLQYSLDANRLQEAEAAAKAIVEKNSEMCAPAAEAVAKALVEKNAELHVAIEKQPRLGGQTCAP